MSKKVLVVSTKGWSNEDITQLNQKINKKNYRWVAKIKNKDNQIKYCHAYAKADMEIMAIQEGYTILKMARK